MTGATNDNASGESALEASDTVTICNQRGLHARAAAKFVKLVAKFDAEVEVERNDMVVSGQSIMGLMMLAASPGCSIRVTAAGPDAEKVMAAIEELIVSRFGEES
jgi:phosphocarrier protein HPr